MKSAFRLGVAGIILVAATGQVTAGQDEDKGATCAQVKLINNFKYVDEKTATVETGPSKTFKVTFTSACRGLKWANAIRVESRPGTCLASGDVVVFSQDGVIPERCFVDKVEALPADATATPGDAKPSEEQK